MKRNLRLRLGRQHNQLLAEGLVVASVTQGREVRNLVKTLGIPANQAFGKKLIMLSAQPKPKIAPLMITVVGPSKARKDDLNVKWDKELVKKGLAKTAAYVDKSVENLSSIVMRSRRERNQCC